MRIIDSKELIAKGRQQNVLRLIITLLVKGIWGIFVYWALLLWTSSCWLHFPIVEDRLSPEALNERVQELHDKAYVADLHTDVFLWQRRDLHQRSDEGHFDFPRMMAGKMDGIILSLPAELFATDWLALRDLPWQAAFNRYDRVHLLLDRFEATRLAWNQMQAEAGSSGLPKLKIAMTGADMRRNERAGVLSVLFGLEGGAYIHNPAQELPALRRRGVIYIGPIHMYNNRFGGNNGRLSKPLGLTDAGREFVQEMQRAGIVIDLAHAGPLAFDDILEVTDGPVLVSHTGFRAFKDITRNLSDKQLKAVAVRKGLVGLMLSSYTLGTNSLENAVIQLEHAIKLMGEAHVTLGSDMDGFVNTLVDAGNVWQLTAVMHRRGWSERRIRRVMGENLILFLERFERHNKRHRAGRP